MPPKKTDQPEEQHVKEKNSWLRRRSVWAGIGVILILLVVGIILTNREPTTFSPEQIALTPVTSNAGWIPYEHDFDGVTMVLVPEGCFLMGSDDGGDDEKPVNQQCFGAPFWIDKYEVTQGDFTRLGGQKAEANAFIGDRLPVDNMAWLEARDFCELRGMRLLTEAEWEYAARGPDNLVYPWGNDFIADNVVYRENSNNQAAEVGSRPGGASWVGALDMSGNVWEWVSSLYQDYPYSADHESNSNVNHSHVMRGGSWDYLGTGYFRATFRIGEFPDSWYYDYGFRCARDAE